MVVDERPLERRVVRDNRRRRERLDDREELLLTASLAVDYERLVAGGDLDQADLCARRGSSPVVSRSRPTSSAPRTARATSFRVVLVEIFVGTKLRLSSLRIAPVA